jgi:hypothetical protein
MSVIGNSPGVASQRVVTTFTATAAQTTFTPISGYTLGYCDVYYNGVKLVAGDDYIAADGVSVVLASGAAAGDVVEVVAHFPRGLSDGYLKAEADSRFLSSADSSVTAAKIAANAVTTAKIADANVTAAKMASGAAVSNIGYTPLNKAGDTMGGTLGFPNSGALLRRNGASGTWVLGYDSATNVLSLGTQGGSDPDILQLCSGGNKISIQADAAGRVTAAYQPSFRAYISTEQSANGVLEGNFWTEQHDTANNFYQGRFTAPVSGVYLFTCMWDASNQGSGVGLLVNTGSYYVQWEPTMNSSGWECYAWSTMIKLSANDYVRLVGQNSSGSGSPFHMGAGYWGHFAGHLLG